MNLEVLNTLADAQKGSAITAYLTTESGERLFSFLYNPEEKKFNRRPIYTSAPTASTSTPGRKYQYTEAKTLSLTNLLMESWGEGKSIRSLLDSLEALTVADVAAGKLAPDTVFFSWGSELFGPATLEDLSWVETAWLGGEPASARVDFTLVQVPVSNSSPSQSATQPTQQQLTTTNLTERQRADAVTASRRWLNDNLNKLIPRIRERVRANAYRFSTTTLGEVRIFDASGTELGVVGTYDGRTLDTSRNTVSQ